MFVNASVAFQGRLWMIRSEISKGRASDKTSSVRAGVVSTTLDTSCAGQSLAEHRLTIGPCYIDVYARDKIDKIVFQLVNRGEVKCGEA